MYEGANKVSAASQSACLGGRAVDYNPTVGENLDRQIADLEERLVNLRASKEALAPLLDMKIGDLRQAMSY